MLSRAVTTESKYSIDVAHENLLKKINESRIILRNVQVILSKLRTITGSAVANPAANLRSESRADLRAESRADLQANPSAKKPPGRKPGHKLCVDIEAATAAISNCVPNIYLDRLDDIERDYKLSTVTILTQYYKSNGHLPKYTKEYYRVLAAGSYFSRVDAICLSCDNMLRLLYDKFSTESLHGKSQNFLKMINDVIVMNDSVTAIGMVCAVEVISYDVCKCGRPMTIYSDLSELRCDHCGICREVLGAVFSDEQFYPQEGQKTKYSDYAHSRHLHFWMDRIKGDEDYRSFAHMLEPIKECIRREGVHSSELSCAYIRKILKELAITKLNHHVAVIIKQCGGPSPPQTTYEDNRDIAIRFNKIMELYDVVNPDRCNKPYYPYFIYKIIESKYKGNAEMLRLLDYIHLQSDLTVIKNDNYYRQICELADPEDGLEFHVTDRTKLQW